MPHSNTFRYRLFGAVCAVPLAALPAAAQAADEARQETVIVTGSPLSPRTADELIQPVTVVSGDELARRAAASIGEVLDGLPGVANADFGPGVGRPAVRGLQGARVQVLDDGLPVVDVSGDGVDHAVAIDTSGAEQIEIFRGPSTLIYGGGAAGGVINVRGLRFDPEISQNGYLNLHGAYGFNGTDRMVDAQGELPVSEGFALRAQGSLRRTQDFSIKGFQEADQDEGFRGRLQNSDIKTEAAAITGIVSGDWGYFAGGYSVWSTDYGLPEVFDPQRIRGDGSDEYERVTADYDRFDIRSDILNPMPGFSRLRIKAGYTQFTQEETEFKFSRADGQFDEAEVEAAFKNNQFDTRVDLLHNPIAGWEGVIGLQYTDRDFFAEVPDEDDESFYVRPNRTRSFGIYLIEEYETDFGRLEFGGRIDNVRSNPKDLFGLDVEGVTDTSGAFLPFPESLSSRSDTAISLSAGTLIDINDSRHLRLAVTRSERVPSPEQLYAFGRHAAAGTFEVGNPDLKKETYLNLEAGIDQHAGPFRFDATVFYNRVDSYVFLQSEDDGTGNPVFVNDIGNRAGEGATIGCQPGDSGLCRLRNQLVFNQQADAEFYGAEIGASYTVEGSPVPLTLFGSADIVRAKLRDGGDLPRITPARVGVGAATRLMDIDLRADYQRVMKQTRTGIAEDETDGFNLVSFDASYEFAPNTQVYLRGRNLLNEDGRRHQSFLKEDAPIIGRAFFIGLRTRLGG